MSVFPQSPPASGWLSSLLRPGYSVALWDARAEEIPKDRLGVAPFEMITLLTFHAEMRRMVDGTLFDNKASMLPEVEWFYNYCDKPWHIDLRTRVRDLNDSLFKSGKLWSRVELRDWKWYCGNGGGS